MKLSNSHIFMYLLFRRTSLLLIVFVFYSNLSFSQGEWAEYLINKEKKLMSIQVDMEFDYMKPNYKNLLIIGTSYKGCLNNGFPNDEGLNELYTFSDSTEIILKKITKKKLVGVITYNCIGLDVYYIKDTINVRSALHNMYQREFNNGKKYIFIKRDRKYEYYKNKLFPPSLSSDLFLDQEYLIELAKSGDKLDDKRKVTHYAYFKNSKKRQKFEANIKALEFQIDSVSIHKEDKYPYHLQFSKEILVNPKSISNNTNLVKTLVNASNSIYGGWGFDPKTEE